MENMPITPDTTDDYDALISEIRDIDTKLNIVSRLSALSVAINFTNRNMERKKLGILY